MKIFNEGKLVQHIGIHSLTRLPKKRIGDTHGSGFEASEHLKERAPLVCEQSRLWRMDLCQQASGSVSTIAYNVALVLSHDGK